MKLIQDYYKIFAWPPLVLVLHVIATYSGAYWEYAWLDIPMHFLGGASIALVIYFALKKLDQQSLWVTMALMIGGGAVAAVGWEWTEYVFDRYFSTLTQLGLFDTLKDLYNGIVGAASMALVVMIKTLRKK